MKENCGADALRGSRARTGPKETEERSPAGSLDAMSSLSVLKTMSEEDRRAAGAVETALPRLALVVEAAVQSISGGGRLVYAGAGTSGRLAAQDAIECAPTFGVAPGTIIWTLAGGEEALVEAMEGVEDDSAAGRGKIE